MVPVSPEQLVRFAHDVNILWDEAQTEPALLRFLAPFGRPDLGRLTRLFSRARSRDDLISEVHPANATWLATLLARDLQGAPPMKVRALAQPQWDSRLLMPGLELTAGLVLASEPGSARDTTGPSRLSTLIIAGGLKAPLVDVRGGCLVVAGDLDTQVLVADGCVLVGGTVRAQVVVNPGDQLGAPSSRDARVERAVGWQVGRAVECVVFDSPRFALSCPVKADVVLRAPNLALTADGLGRAGERLTPGLLAPPGLALEAMLSRVRRGGALLR
jgi:hypothetical protein